MFQAKLTGLEVHYDMGLLITISLDKTIKVIRLSTFEEVNLEFCKSFVCLYVRLSVYKVASSSVRLFVSLFAHHLSVCLFVSLFARYLFASMFIYTTLVFYVRK